MPLPDPRQCLPELTPDEGARIALRLAPHQRESIVAAATAPGRVELLIELAVTGGWIEKLVDAASLETRVQRNINAQLTHSDPGHRAAGDCLPRE